MRFIFVFIDGFGLGEHNVEKNPIFRANAPNIHRILSDACTIPVDASLGVSGLPQSATGQTAIFTGVNASFILGRHLSGQPTETLRNIIHNDNIFQKLIQMGLTVTNSNVYRQEYLLKMMDTKDRKYRPSVTSVMTMSAGIRFRTVEDFNRGKGIYHDITGDVLLESGYEVNLITPVEAAERLYSISRDFDFTLFEHFMTDIIGHKADMEQALKQITLLDSFVGKLIELLDSRDILMITSDHGNIEDVTVKTHTMNKVPLVIIGKVRETIKASIVSLTDIMPAVIEIFKAGEEGRNTDGS